MIDKIELTRKLRLNRKSYAFHKIIENARKEGKFENVISLHSAREKKDAN